MQEEFSIEEYRKDESKSPSKMERFLESRYFLALVIILVAVSSFCLGRISKIEDLKVPVRVISGNVGGGEVKGESIEVKESVQIPAVSSDSGTTVVASKNGTKYHLPTCPGAKQISDKNKITFSSTESARASGYTPAANCKGLK